MAGAAGAALAIALLAAPAQAACDTPSGMITQFGERDTCWGCDPALGIPQAGIGYSAQYSRPHYTVAEVDRMREAVRAIVTQGYVHWLPNGGYQSQVDVDSAVRSHTLTFSGDIIPEAEMDHRIEDRLRTYILAGVRAEELEQKAEKK